MRKPNAYNETSAGGDFKSLPAGGYVVVIKKIEETKSKSSGVPQLKIALDIAEGEYKDYFMNLFRKRKEEHPMDAKWPNNGIKYINVEKPDGSCDKFFKGFCTSLENSGHTVWSDSDVFLTDQLAGKTVGMTFGREEYEWKGKNGWSTKPAFFCSVEDIHNGNFRVPEDKYLDGSTVAGMMPEFQALPNDDVPF